MNSCQPRQAPATTNAGAVTNNSAMAILRAARCRVADWSAPSMFTLGMAGLMGSPGSDKSIRSEDFLP